MDAESSPRLWVFYLLGGALSFVICLGIRKGRYFDPYRHHGRSEASCHPTDRIDLLSKLQQGRDSEGKPMGREELTAEALTLLIAGSDNTSK